MKLRAVFSSCLALLFLSLAEVFLNASPAEADAVVTVTTYADELNIDGDCSLREAVRAANTNTAVDGCAAGTPGVDTIDLPGGTYTLTIVGADDTAVLGDLDITGNLMIVGAGNAIIKGGTGWTDRILHFNPSGIGSITVHVSNVTVKDGLISGGAGGGGVYNNAGSILTLTSVTIMSNTVTGGAAGGGIFNSGTLTLTQSTISANSALGGGFGAGIYNGGMLTAINSTLSSNIAYGDGGGIYNDATTNLRNVTVAFNTADYDNNGGDGGGLIFASGIAFNVKNTIIAQNIDGSLGNEAPDCSGVLTSQGSNLVQNIGASCSLAGGSGDLIGPDPYLGPLQGNDGSTFTHALLDTPLSPAIDAGSGCEATDQRGGARPVGLACDIGSFEFGVVFYKAYLPLVLKIP
jgi:CSLREA domain-containing protein